MANINKIRLSGTSYDIQDLNATKVVDITQAAYDALPSSAKTANILYNITDAEAIDISEYWTSAETQSAITEATSGKVSTSDFNTYSGSVNTALNSKASQTDLNTLSGTVTAHTANTLIHVSPEQVAAWNAKSDFSGSYNDLTNKLSAGTNVTIVDNVISAEGGGGKTIVGGRGITVTTGETADTISFNLPISAGTGTNSVAEGYLTKASGHSSHAEGYKASAKGNQAHAEGRDTNANSNYSHAEGENTYTYGIASHAEGTYTIANNESEHASGRFNVSSKASSTFGDSGNTLFSVGNGTSNSARHNAFEIRQNGDIYLSLNGQDVKLQDQLGGGGSSYTAGDGIDITNDVISVTGKADTSAVTEVSDAFTAHTADTTIHVTASDKATWNAKSDFSGSYNDLTNKLSAGTNITIVDNVISAEGGGKAVTGGTNISVTTGETADTINCTIPLTVGSSNSSLSLGIGNKLNSSNRTLAIGDSNIIYNSTVNSLVGGMRSSINYNCGNSIAFGYQANVGGKYSCSIGGDTTTKNSFETSFGRYNNPISGSTTFGDSGNTLFSVGNGTADNARHNAFEIRQNGDIYCSDGTNDVKLQDTITATAANTTALGGLKLIKLSQSEYDSLVTKDNSTLYVING